MTFKAFFLVAGFGFATALFAMQQPEASPITPITLPRELDRVLRDYERHWVAGDEAGLAALFTTDGFVPNRSGWVRGRKAIEANYREAQNPLYLRAYAYAAGDSVAYIIGGYRSDSTPNARDGGKFVLPLRRSGGRWLIAADLDQPNR